MTKECDFAEEEPLVVRDDEGRIVVQVGLLATLYFEGGHRPEVRDAVATGVDRLQALYGQHLRWVAHPKSGKIYSATSGRVPSLRAWMAQRSSNQAWEYHTHGGEHPDAANDFLIEAFAHGEWKQALGHLTFALPLTWFAEHPGHFPGLVLELCDLVKPVHGYGGLGILESFDMGVENRFQPAVYAMARRFPGLEADRPGSHMRYLKEGIKGVNWLTVLSERWLLAVGGLVGLRSALDSDVLVREYPGGILIQAGSRPEMGDVNDGRVPDLYCRVARVLRPIRVRTIGSLHYAGAHRFNTATTDEWLRRFDLD